MKNPHLIASIAAVLITSATLSAMSENYSADFQQAPASMIDGIKVTNLAPINVTPSAQDRRAASLLTDASVTGMATLPSLGQSGDAGQFSLIGSQLAMPYYSFGNKFGRISKE